MSWEIRMAEPEPTRRLEIELSENDASQKCHSGLMDGKVVLPKVRHCDCCRQKCFAAQRLAWV
jgi:hypothetical protein